MVACRWRPLAPLLLLLCLSFALPQSAHASGQLSAFVHGGYPGHAGNSLAFELQLLPLVAARSELAATWRPGHTEVALLLGAATQLELYQWVPRALLLVGVAAPQGRVAADAGFELDRFWRMAWAVRAGVRGQWRQQRGFAANFSLGLVYSW